MIYGDPSFYSPEMWFFKRWIFLVITTKQRSPVCMHWFILYVCGCFVWVCVSACGVFKTFLITTVLGEHYSSWSMLPLILHIIQQNPCSGTFLCVSFVNTTVSTVTLIFVCYTKDSAQQGRKESVSIGHLTAALSALLCVWDWGHNLNLAAQNTGQTSVWKDWAGMLRWVQCFLGLATEA